MTPWIDIRVDGVANAVIADRLLSLRATDEARLEADLLEIEIDNRDGAVETPRRGVEIALSLGFREQGLLTEIGLYRVTALSGGGPARTVTVIARAAALDGAIRDPRTRAWEGVSLGGIARAIAARHGLAVRVAPAFEAPVQASVEQAEESDLNLLTRLAQDAGALATVKGRTLILLEEGAGLTAAGAALPETRLAAADCASWTWRVEDREAFGAVRAFWRDLGAAEKRAVEVGDAPPGEPGTVFELRRVYATEADARRAARVRLNRFARAAATLSLRAPFSPQASADAPLVLSGFDAVADGRWRIARVEHGLGPQGLGTSIEAERQNPTQES